jgi:hypothetical protein
MRAMSFTSNSDHDSEYAGGVATYNLPAYRELISSP